MFYAAFTDAQGVEHSKLYHSVEEFHRDTFSPETENLTVVDFSVHGKTYNEQQANLRETAIRFQTEQRPGLPWAEVWEIGAWFEKMGRRYGLIREFRENAVCA